jgi:two-component system sensor histidine kinase ChiS
MSETNTRGKDFASKSISIIPNPGFVVVPEADFMAQIHANNRTTALLCLAALGMATVLGILTSRWIVHPILKLKDAAKDLSEGEFDRTVELDRADELGVLATAFNSMASQLQAYFTTFLSIEWR